MKLINSKIDEYVEALSSGAPAPGGGAVAALTAAQGAALIMMVANLTIGKKKFADIEEFNIKVRDEAKGYMDQLMAGVDEDKEAFTKVANAYAMPKTTDTEKSERRDAIAIASVGAADAPLKVMREGCAALELADSMIGNSNPQLESDLYVAAMNLNAGIQAAKFNVDANVPFIANEDLADNCKTAATMLSIKAKKLADKILCKK